MDTCAEYLHEMLPLVVVFSGFTIKQPSGLNIISAYNFGRCDIGQALSSPGQASV